MWKCKNCSVYSGHVLLQSTRILGHKRHDTCFAWCIVLEMYFSREAVCATDNLLVTNVIFCDSHRWSKVWGDLCLIQSILGNIYVRIMMRIIISTNQYLSEKLNIIMLPTKNNIILLLLYYAIYNALSFWRYCFESCTESDPWESSDKIKHLISLFLSHLL